MITTCVSDDVKEKLTLRITYGSIAWRLTGLKTWKILLNEAHREVTIIVMFSLFNMPIDSEYISESLFYILSAYMCVTVCVQ